jgi:hypothetical protein
MDKLWRGIDAKLDYAQFHLEKTSEALVPGYKTTYRHKLT